jgi:hypothetical protein
MVFRGECFLSVICPQTTHHPDDDWSDGNKHIIPMVTLQDWWMLGHYILQNVKGQTTGGIVSKMN